MPTFLLSVRLFEINSIVSPTWSGRPRDADSRSQYSGVPAAVPSSALVSYRPTVLLTALNIPHHRHGLGELQMGAEKSHHPEYFIFYLWAHNGRPTLCADLEALELFGKS